MRSRSRLKIHAGADAFFNDLLGVCKRKSFSLATARRDAAAALDMAEKAACLSDADLEGRIAESRESVRLGAGGAAVLAALALASEAASRTLGIRPYVEQLMGAMLIQGNVAIQMHTGEGKTITAGLAAVLRCWKGSLCHIVTSNDYLAKRDAELMAPLYSRCRLRVGYVIAGMKPDERRQAYDCNIVYSTSKELLADFLRDKMAEGTYRLYETAPVSKPRGRAVMRGLDTAIVDEADSVLADEATVPLIISIAGKNRLLKEAVLVALEVSARLKEGEDYTADQSRRDITITERGRQQLQEALQDFPAIWSSYERSEYLITQALVAQRYYHRDVHYVINEGKVVIVDEKTGRMMPGRSWSGGLHQAIEVKEGLELTEVTESHIQMSFQMFFRQYRNLSGMSGTLQNIERELWSIYGLVAVRIPTHAPKKLSAYPERIFATMARKWDEVMAEVSREMAKGKAVLVGTRSIRESESLLAELARRGVGATVLNALRHEQEAEIIARAGRRGAVTIATNMAGRGTNILVDREVLDAGGLHVIATERHESRRVDMQLFGRTARQGQPGSARMMVSLDDELMRGFSLPRVVGWLKKLLDTRIGSKVVLVMVIWFQRRAEKSRSLLRKKILGHDLAMSKMMSFTKF